MRSTMERALTGLPVSRNKPTQNFRMSSGFRFRMMIRANKVRLRKMLGSFIYRALDGHVAEWLRSGLQMRRRPFWPVLPRVVRY
jgi:hypothetical protein